MSVWMSILRVSIFVLRVLIFSNGTSHLLHTLIHYQICQRTCPWTLLKLWCFIRWLLFRWYSRYLSRVDFDTKLLPLKISCSHTSFLKVSIILVNWVLWHLESGLIPAIICICLILTSPTTWGRFAFRYDQYLIIPLTVSVKSPGINHVAASYVLLLLLRIKAYNICCFVILHFSLLFFLLGQAIVIDATFLLQHNRLLLVELRRDVAKWEDIRAMAWTLD